MEYLTSNSSFSLDATSNASTPVAAAASRLLLAAFPGGGISEENLTVSSASSSPVTLVHVVLALLTLAGLRIAKFFADYWSARAQFPSPPISSIFRGNLPELMVDNVHERWRQWHRELGPVYQTVSLELFP